MCVHVRIGPVRAHDVACSMHGTNEETNRDQKSNPKPSDPESGAAKNTGSFQHHFETTSEVGDDDEGRAERQRSSKALSHIRLPDHVQDVNDELFNWAKIVLRVVDDHCSWVLDPGKEMSQADLTAAIKKTPAGRFQVRSTYKDSDYVGIWSRHGVGFEANARPWERLPSCQERLKTRIQATSTRFPETGDALPEKDIYFQSDHGKHGLKDIILAPFNKAKPKVKGLTYLSFDGPAMRARKNRQRGSYAACKSTEWLHVVSQKKLKIPLKDNIHYPGVNIDDGLGPIVMPNLDAPEVMRVLYKEKAAFYGYARVKCGGPVSDGEESAEDSDSSIDGTKKKEPIRVLPKPSDEVPMTYNNVPWQVYDEITHGANIKAWIETTTADETLALVCCLREIPFTGVVPTEAMREALEARLVGRLWAKFSDEKDKDHKIQLVKLLKPETGKAKEEKGPDNKQTKKRSLDEGDEAGTSTGAQPAVKKPVRKAAAKEAAGANDTPPDDVPVEVQSLLKKLRASESDVPKDGDE